MRILYLKPQPDPNADAALILAYTLRHGHAPLLAPYALTPERLERAMARAAYAIRRTADEYPPSVDAITAAIRALSASREARRKADRDQGETPAAPPAVVTRTKPGSAPQPLAPLPKTDPHGPNGTHADIDADADAAADADFDLAECHPFNARRGARLHPDFDF